MEDGQAVQRHPPSSMLDLRSSNTAGSFPPRCTSYSTMVQARRSAMKPATIPSPKRTTPPLATPAQGGAGRHSRMRRRAALWIVGALAVGAIATYLAYTRDMRATRDRLAAGSQVIATRHGPIEYTSWGEGPAVLVIHGAGGGYDQGVAIARAFGGDGFRWISPSRFGYLRTPLPADASTAAQADAFADLLDALNIKRVAILAFSGGV